ncbi:mrna decapping complex subunit 2 [Trichoderma arundinaceum]|uniref:Mrna decapping complex subunit 2 n=1 Tax=Trichoderma arundinaceum TaxID=490622 RepID=A0A395NH92_TRIAR|nr:mrna decapping complex subunit 2 [Trichoderma arundinaceum]
MAQKQMQLEDWLDDLCVRFIINLPQEDLSSVARLCFQVEEAQWFYEDFIRPLDPTLPSMTLRTFCLRIFQHCPLLASFSVENHIKAFEEFLQYKTRVPVRGAIMLNKELDSVVLVKGWKKGASWSFPRGKINKDEDDLDCAVREVYEETGLDLRESGLVPTEGKPKYIEIPMREQHLRLYVFRDVPMDTVFQPRTRKEISKIEWYKLSDLPTLRKKGPQNNNHQYDSSPGTNANKFYMVAPFLVPLKKWIISQKKSDEKRTFSGGPQVNAIYHQHMPIEEDPTEDEAWIPNVPAAVPAIESLDGATRELQRLLNLQPSAQPPVQPAEIPPAAAPKDKGSALLSLLQSSSSTTQRAPQDSHISNLLSTLTSGRTEQPRNPQYNANAMPQASTSTKQPLPNFASSANQASAAWNLLQNRNQGQGSGAPAPSAQPTNPGYAITSQQTYTASTTTIKASPMQPPRILQRGETLQQAQQVSPTEQAKPNPAPYTGPYDHPGQPRPGQVPQPSPSTLPIPISSQSSAYGASNYNYRPEVSQEQKRNLLSLFGTPKTAAANIQPQPVSQTGPAAAGPSMPRLASLAAGNADGLRNAPPSRNSNATPISQADQSFLLDYLQSVTKNAAR